MTLSNAAGEEKRAAALLQPGVTCWRIAHAGRATMLVDAEAYVSAMSAAMRNAQRSILLLGWDFDPRVPLQQTIEADGGTERLCDLIGSVISKRPDLYVSILIWDMAWPLAIQRRDSPKRAARWLPFERLNYRLDGTHPPGAAHHQKILVVDDKIAFCGGADFTRNRWDTPAHQPADKRRRTLSGAYYGPRHEVVLAVDGAAAAALAELARERWRRATGDEIPAVGLLRIRGPSTWEPTSLR